MKHILILSLTILLIAAAPAQKSEIDQHYKEGQRLFGEKEFAVALEEFLEVDRLVPDEPQVYSWIAACLNELGRHAEAKERLERAFDLLRQGQQQARDKKQPVPPIALGYFTLLSSVQVNLQEFEQAVATLRSYPLEDDGGEEGKKAKQAFDAAKQTLKARLVATGTDCLRGGDLACARTTFSQAEMLHPGSPPVQEVVARDAWAQGDKAPATTEEDKAKKAELQEEAVEAARLWVEQAAPAAVPQAQRLLAKALSGTKKKENYEEAIHILTGLVQGCADQQLQQEGSIHLELAVAQAGLEQWDLAASSATSFIELDPNDPLGQGYCMRSFAQYQLGRCSEAIEDGQHCKNADGTQRMLKHVETCQQRLAKLSAERAAAQAAQEAKLERKCDHLYDRVKWARSFVEEISFDDLVTIIGDYKAGHAECAQEFDEAERRVSGNGFSSPTSTLCAAGAKTASFPLNLSTRSKGDLESLRDRTKEFLSLCGSSMNAGQTGGVEAGLHKVEEALERVR